MMAEKTNATATPEKKVTRFPPELQAMSRIGKILKPFSQAAQLRILDWNRSNVTEVRPQGCIEELPDPNGDL